MSVEHTKPTFCVCVCCKRGRFIFLQGAARGRERENRITMYGGYLHVSRERERETFVLEQVTVAILLARNIMPLYSTVLGPSVSLPHW
jgi:hypothetical protein